MGSWNATWKRHCASAVTKAAGSRHCSLVSKTPAIIEYILLWNRVWRWTVYVISALLLRRLASMTELRVKRVYNCGCSGLSRSYGFSFYRCVIWTWGLALVVAGDKPTWANISIHVIGWMVGELLKCRILAAKTGFVSVYIQTYEYVHLYRQEQN